MIMDEYYSGSNGELMMQSSGGAAEDSLIAGLSGGLLIASLLITIVSIIGLWRVFTKAGKPGWAAIVPIYNWYVLLQIVGRPAWWTWGIVAAFVPFIGWIPALILSIIVTHDLAKSFGKDIAWTIFLILLSPIAYLMLGFGNAQYQGPAALKAAGGAGALPSGGVIPQDGQATGRSPVSPAADASVAQSGPATPSANPYNGSQTDADKRV
jgi:multisubunit Na+/H+ antiporter MnhG subunit